MIVNWYHNIVEYQNKYLKEVKEKNPTISLLESTQKYKPQFEGIEEWTGEEMERGDMRKLLGWICSLP